MIIFLANGKKRIFLYMCPKHVSKIDIHNSSALQKVLIYSSNQYKANYIHSLKLLWKSYISTLVWML